MKEHRESVARVKEAKEIARKAAKRLAKEEAALAKGGDAKEPKPKPALPAKKPRFSLGKQCLWTCTANELEDLAKEGIPCIGYCTGVGLHHPCACPRPTRCGKKTGNQADPSHILQLQADRETDVGPFCGRCQVAFFDRQYWMR